MDPEIRIFYAGEQKFWHTAIMSFNYKTNHQFETIKGYGYHKNGFALIYAEQKLYIIGGCNMNNDEVLNTVEIFDPFSGSWSSGAPMITARRYFRCACLNGEIYAIGGFDDNDDELKSVEKYNIESNSWQLLAEMSEDRSNLAVGVLNQNLYVMGGWNADKGILSSCERYDPVLNQWFQDVSPMNHIRSCHAATVVDNLLYAVGGMDNATAERYNPVTNTWELLPKMSCPRWYLGVSNFQNKVYAMGGKDHSDHELNSIEVFDPITNLWAPGTSLPTVGAYCILTSSE